VHKSYEGLIRRSANARDLLEHPKYEYVISRKINAFKYRHSFVAERVVAGGD
jgi:hypothetical protein